MTTDLPIRLRQCPVLPIQPVDVNFDPKENSMAAPDKNEIVAALNTLGKDKSGFIEGVVVHDQCEKLNSFCKDNAINCKIVLQNGGIPMLLNAMYCYMMHTGLVTDVCSVLLHLAASSSQCCHHLGQMAIPYLVDAIYNHFGNAQLLKMLCRLAIAISASDANASLEMVRVGARVVLRFVQQQLLQVRPDNELDAEEFDLLDATLETMPNTELDPPPEAVLWGTSPPDDLFFVYTDDPDCVRRILHAMTNPDNSLGFSLGCLGLLYQASTVRSAAWEAFHSDEHIHTLIQVLKMDESIGRSEIVALGARITGNLCQDERIREILGRSGAIELMVSLLKEMDDNEILILWSLSAMVESIHPNQDRFCETGGLIKVFQAMAGLRPTMDVHIRQMHLLSNLVFDNEFTQVALVRMNGLPRLINLICSAMECQEFQQQAVALLACLSEPRINRVTLAQIGTVAVLIPLLAHFWFDSVIQSNTTRCLENLMEYGLVSATERQKIDEVLEYVGKNLANDGIADEGVVPPEVKMPTPMPDIGLTPHPFGATPTHADQPIWQSSVAVPAKQHAAPPATPNPTLPSAQATTAPLIGSSASSIEASQSNSAALSEWITHFVKEQETLNSASFGSIALKGPGVVVEPAAAVRTGPFQFSEDSQWQMQQAVQAQRSARSRSISSTSNKNSPKAEATATKSNANQTESPVTVFTTENFDQMPTEVLHQRIKDLRKQIQTSEKSEYGLVSVPPPTKTNARADERNDSDDLENRLRCLLEKQMLLDDPPTIPPPSIPTYPEDSISNTTTTAISDPSDQKAAPPVDTGPFHEFKQRYQAIMEKAEKKYEEQRLVAMDALERDRVELFDSRRDKFIQRRMREQLNRRHNAATKVQALMRGCLIRKFLRSRFAIIALIKNQRIDRDAIITEESLQRALLETRCARMALTLGATHITIPFLDGSRSPSMASTTAFTLSTIPSPVKGSAVKAKSPNSTFQSPTTLKKSTRPPASELEFTKQDPLPLITGTTVKSHGLDPIYDTIHPSTEITPARRHWVSEWAKELQEMRNLQATKIQSAWRRHTNRLDITGRTLNEMERFERAEAHRMALMRSAIQASHGRALEDLQKQSEENERAFLLADKQRTLRLIRQREMRLAELRQIDALADLELEKENRLRKMRREWAHQREKELQMRQSQVHQMEELEWFEQERAQREYLQLQLLSQEMSNSNVNQSAPPSGPSRTSFPTSTLPPLHQTPKYQTTTVSQPLPVTMSDNRPNFQYSKITRIQPDNHLLNLLKNPTHRHVRSAVRIQAAYRGFSVRKQVRKARVMQYLIEKERNLQHYMNLAGFTDPMPLTSDNVDSMVLSKHAMLQNLPNKVIQPTLVDTPFGPVPSPFIPAPVPPAPATHLSNFSMMSHSHTTWPGMGPVSSASMRNDRYGGGAGKYVSQRQPLVSRHPALGPSEGNAFLPALSQKPFAPPTPVDERASRSELHTQNRTADQAGPTTTATYASRYQPPQPPPSNLGLNTAAVSNANATCSHPMETKPSSVAALPSIQASASKKAGPGPVKATGSGAVGVDGGNAFDNNRGKVERGMQFLRTL